MDFAPVEHDMPNNDFVADVNSVTPSIEVWVALIEQSLAIKQDIFSQTDLQFKIDLLAQIAHASRFLELEVNAALHHGYVLTLEEFHEVVDAFDMSGLPRHSRSYALPIVMTTGSSNLRQAYLRALSKSKKLTQEDRASLFGPILLAGSGQGAASRGQLSLLS